MKYQYWFLCLKGIGNVTKKRLITYYGSAKELYAASEESLRASHLLDERQIHTILDSKKDRDPGRALEVYLACGGRFVTVEDEDYPKMLLQVHDRPYGLFERGVSEGIGERTVAIVGARRCTPYGQKMAYDLGYGLAKAGYTVVSGMARGIDGAAHQGCLDGGGQTVAVLGCGTDICYPKPNAGLYREILKKGKVISEYSDGTQPLAEHFPARNRIISGLARQVIVVEAKEKSGSLITADFALEQGKDIYAVPGRCGDAMSAGCNRLIAQGAGVICSVEDYLRECMETEGLQHQKYVPKESQNFSLEKEERLVYSCVDFYPKGLDQIQGETKLEILPLLAAVMKLCDLGLIQENFKNQYVRLG